jgi:general secretion pathway protein D
MVPEKQPAQAPGGERPFDFSFNNAPIDTVISNIMRELGYSYMIDPKVTGTVSIFTQRGIPRSQLFGVLEQILKMNGQAIVKQGDLYVVAPLGEAPRLPHVILESPKGGGQKEKEKETPGPPTGEQKPGTTVPPGTTAIELQKGQESRQLEAEQGVVTYIIPLHYLASEYMKQMAQVFVSEGANVIDFAPANILIITDHRRNIQQVLDMINLLDTQYFSINNVELIQIKSNLAKDVAEDLAKIFAPGDKSAVRIIAIERLNSILAVTHSPSVLQEVKAWVEKLDSPSASTNIKTFVYQVENNTAMNIADVLAQLYQDGAGLPSSPMGTEAREGQSTTSGSLREPGFVGSQQSGGLGGYNNRYGGYGSGYGSSYGGYGDRGGMGRLGGQIGPSLAGRPMSNQVGVRAVVSGNLKVIVNEYNNSLIIQATQADYDFLLETIKQLDVLPRQCLIEAKVYSVTLTDDLSFGVSAFLEKRGQLGTNEVATPPTTASIGGTTGGALSIVSRTFIGAERQLEAAITALRARTNVELVEAPRLLAMDGMQATFNVGAEVPVTTASFGDPLQSGSATSFINSIQFRPTGTTLLISPRISASGIVTMDLAIEVSSASGGAQSLTPTINRNYVETSLIIRDSQTVAIAGIISEQVDSSRNRVPLLGDVPILGTLFGTTSRNKSRRELVFLITPHVVPNLPTATELTLEFRRAMRKAYDFMRAKEQDEQDLINKRRDEEMRELEKQQPKDPAAPPNGGKAEPEKKGPSAFLRPHVLEVFAGNRQKVA